MASVIDKDLKQRANGYAERAWLQIGELSRDLHTMLESKPDEAITEDDLEAMHGLIHRIEMLTNSARMILKLVADNPGEGLWASYGTPDFVEATNRFRKFVASEVEGFLYDVEHNPDDCLMEPYAVDLTVTRTVCAALAEYLNAGFDSLDDLGWEGRKE